MVLPKKFYQKDTLKVAQELLGCFLVRKMGNKLIKGTITETEAYIGEDDLACHASKGRTKRTETMYGEAGRAYVYMIYGMYHCMNIITERKNFPAAVLIRAIKIEGVDYKKTNGPGKLCKFLKIYKELNGINITKKDKLWVEPGIKIKKTQIHKDKRIGVDYAQHCQHYLWRFYVRLEK
jgi:DNA-3-methyladenine glycosylase